MVPLHIFDLDTKKWYQCNHTEFHYAYPAVKKSAMESTCSKITSLTGSITGYVGGALGVTYGKEKWGSISSAIALAGFILGAISTIAGGRQLLLWKWRIDAVNRLRAQIEYLAHQARLENQFFDQFREIDPPRQGSGFDLVIHSIAKNAKQTEGREKDPLLGLSMRKIPR